MATRTRTYLLWCLGLDSGDVEKIRVCAGVNHQIVVLPEDRLPSLEDIEREEPVLLWIGRECWRRFLSIRDGENFAATEPFPGASKDRFLEYIPQVLVLPGDCIREDLELALEGGFQDVVRGELSAKRIHEILRRSLEISNIHRDMDRMTREILLNRELLTRKSDVLAFLLHFTREVAPSADWATVLGDVRSCLTELLPLEAMHGAFWRQDSDGLLHVELRMELTEEENGFAEVNLSDFPDLDGAELPESFDVRQVWADVLLETVSSFIPVPVSHCQVTQICALPRSGEGLGNLGGSGCDVLPDASRLLLLPLGIGDAPAGVLALVLTEECPLGRDQALALDAAMRHLAGVLGYMAQDVDNPAAFADPSSLSRIAL